jgi:hypothetical protein
MSDMKERAYRMYERWGRDQSSQRFIGDSIADELEAVQREERERCAKIADKVFSEFDDDYENASNFLEKVAARLQGDGAAKVARAIRSVGCPT